MIGALLGGKKEKDKQLDDAAAKPGASNVAVKTFAMAGASHTLKIAMVADTTDVTLASREGDLLGKLEDQRKTEENLIKSTTGATQKQHIDAEQEIRDIQKWAPTRKAAMVVAIKAVAPDPVKIQAELTKYGDELTEKLVALGLKYQA